MGAIAGWLVFKLVDWCSPVGAVGEAQARQRAASSDDRPGAHRAPLQKGPVQEKLTITAGAILVTAVALKYGGPSTLLFVYGALMLVLMGVTLFDVRRHEIPHIVTLPGMAAGLLLGTFVLPLGFIGSVAGLVVGGGVLLVVTLFEALRKKEIGGGDWKYAAMIGSFIGPQKMVIALVFTGVLGFIGAIALALTGHGGRPQALGPWLGAGAAASILLG